MAVSVYCFEGLQGGDSRGDPAAPEPHFTTSDTALGPFRLDYKRLVLDCFIWD